MNKLFLHKYLASSINGTASIPYTFTTRIHTNATYTPETTFHITTCTRSNADGLTSTANKINTTILKIFIPKNKANDVRITFTLVPNETSFTNIANAHNNQYAAEATHDLANTNSFPPIINESLIIFGAYTHNDAALPYRVKGKKTR